MTARKDDKGKPPISLIARSALLAEARVMEHGKQRYQAHNWKGGMEWSRLIDAAMRHILAFADGEDFDNGEGGSGELHLANARCCLAFLIEYHEKGLGTDDRYKPESTDALPDVPPWGREGFEYQVVAKDLRGDETVIESNATLSYSVIRMESLAADWPTFKLFVREVSSGYSETA